MSPVGCSLQGWGLGVSRIGLSPASCSQGNGGTSPEGVLGDPGVGEKSLCSGQLGKGRQHGHCSVSGPAPRVA